MANNCNKLMKEALDGFLGIDYRYKMNDLLDSLPSNQKFNSEQLKGYMIKQGVSPKEIDASKIFKGFENDNRALTIEEWKGINPSNQTLYRREMRGYEGITLGKQGVSNPTYHVNEFMTKDKIEGNTNLKHKMQGPSMYNENTQLGWNRVHQDTINGKPTTVLNELQSDWMQAERQGAGTFESNKATIDIQNIKEQIRNLETEKDNLFIKASDSWLNKNNLTLEQAFELNDLGKIDYTDEVFKFQEANFIDDANRTDSIFKELEKLDNILKSQKNTIKDFPMKPEKFQQLMIVDAINEAISNGTMRVAIPIERTGRDLVGTEGVTRFYESLNKKILPDIRSKLEKQGLRIKLSQEEYKVNNYANKLHILEINEVPNAKVKWDVYGLLTSIGLGAYTSNLNIKEN